MSLIEEVYKSPDLLQLLGGLFVVAEFTLGPVCAWPRGDGPEFFLQVPGPHVLGEGEAGGGVVFGEHLVEQVVLGVVGARSRVLVAFALDALVRVDDGHPVGAELAGGELAGLGDGVDLLVGTGARGDLVKTGEEAVVGLGAHGVLDFGEGGTGRVGAWARVLGGELQDGVVLDGIPGRPEGLAHLPLEGTLQVVGVRGRRVLLPSRGPAVVLLPVPESC